MRRAAAVQGVGCRAHHATHVVFRLDVRALIEQQCHKVLAVLVCSFVQRRLAILCAPTRSKHGVCRGGTHASACRGERGVMNVERSARRVARRTLSFASLFAPVSSSSVTTSALSLLIAQRSGVKPSCVRPHTANTAIATAGRMRQRAAAKEA